MYLNFLMSDAVYFLHLSYVLMRPTAVRLFLHLFAGKAVGSAAQ